MHSNRPQEDSNSLMNEIDREPAPAPTNSKRAFSRRGFAGSSVMPIDSAFSHVFSSAKQWEDDPHIPGSTSPGPLPTKIEEERKFSFANAIGKIDQLYSEETAEIRKRISGLYYHVYNPNDPRLLKWDVLMAVLLIYTALVCPYEIAFCESCAKVGHTIFVINRLVDIGFILDIFVQFRLMYFDSTLGEWIVDRNKIFWHYVEGMFAVELVATVPWDLVSLLVEAETNSASDLDQIKLLRLLKVVKLTKLLRLSKSAKIFEKLAMNAGLPYSTKDLIKYIAIMLLSSHLIACGWAMIPAFAEATEEEARRRQLKGTSSGETVAGAPGGWIAAAEGQVGGVLTKADIYAFSLEYSLSVMCMGYGTINPTNSAERWYSVVCLVAAGALYAYIIGAICAVAQSEDPGTAAYKYHVDLLHALCAENKIDRVTRQKTLDYFSYCKGLIQNQQYCEVFKFLSPSLRAGLAKKMHGHWIRRIPFFRAESKREREEFINSVVCFARTKAYPPHESIVLFGDDCKAMWIVMQGMLRKIFGSVDLNVTTSFQLLTAGDFFGTEIFIKGRICTESVKTLTYAACYELDGDELRSLLETRANVFRGVLKMIRRHAIRFALLTGVKRIGSLIIETKTKLGVERLSARRLESVTMQFRQNAQQKSERNKKESVQTQLKLKMAKLKAKAHNAVIRKQNQLSLEIDLLTSKNKELEMLTGFPDVLMRATDMPSIDDIANAAVDRAHTNVSKSHSNAKKKKASPVMKSRKMHRGVSREEMSVNGTARSAMGRRFVSNAAVDGETSDEEDELDAIQIEELS